MTEIVVAGIDEAGLGPVLGPLVVAATAFDLPAAEASHDLWPLLAPELQRRAAAGCLVVDDSKRVLAGARGRRELERTVLAALAVCGRRPATAAALLDRLAPGARATAAELPWYGACDLPLPLWVTPDEADAAAERLALSLAERGCRLAMVEAAVLFAVELNDLVAGGLNKAEAAFTRVVRSLTAVLAVPAPFVDLRVDRLGGRKHYRAHLERACPGAVVWTLGESAASSRYRVERAAGAAAVEFAVGGDASSLPVALASMVAKYQREVLMTLLNRYWTTRVAGLAPTAGYPVDGRRFVAALEAAAALAPDDRRRLVRCR